MECKAILSLALAALLGTAIAAGQSNSTPTAPATAQYASQPATASATGQASPVSYASVTQLNGLLGQLEASAKTAQDDLVRLRIERWKTDKSTKEQALANVDSLQRNLRGALPEIIGQLRAAPEDLPATFKLYRNLDALYDVLGNVVELTGAFGSKDDVQSLGNDLNAFERTRRQMAERIETLSAAKEAEIVRLRTDLKTAHAAVPVEPPKKVVVDDNEPPKKPAVKKKPAAKPTAAPPAAGTKPAPGQAQTPGQPPAAKPQ